MLENVLNGAMSHQAQEQRGAGYNERGEGRTNSRNGYRECGLATLAGDVTLKVPKLRKGVYDPSDVVERWCRVDKAAVCAIAEMYVAGVSTRSVDRIVRQLGIDRMPKSTVSEMCAGLDAAVC